MTMFVNPFKVFAIAETPESPPGPPIRRRKVGTVMGSPNDYVKMRVRAPSTARGGGVCVEWILGNDLRSRTRRCRWWAFPCREARCPAWTPCIQRCKCQRVFRWPTVAIDNATNAGILVTQMFGITDP